MKDGAGQEQFDQDHRNGEDEIGDDAGREHVAGRHWGDVEAAQDSLFPERDKSRAESPETAHHIKSEDGAEIKRHHLRNALGKYPQPYEEKSKRHHQDKEEEHFVSHGQLDAHARECDKVLQSRSLLPVISMKTSSREGEDISRLTSSLPPASRCLTRETIVCGGRFECNT